MAAREKNFLLEVISRYHESGYLGEEKARIFSGIEPTEAGSATVNVALRCCSTGNGQQCL